MCHRRQHWDLLTSHKPEAEKNVTKEDFVSFFLVCYGVLLPEDQVSARDRMQAIEVRGGRTPQLTFTVKVCRIAAPC